MSHYSFWLFSLDNFVTIQHIKRVQNNTEGAFSHDGEETSRRLERKFNLYVTLFPWLIVVNYEAFMSAKIFLSSFIVVMSVIPNACLVEQVIASVAEMIHHGPHQNSHGDKQTAPSHSHDEEGHEEDFCCDNESYRYFGSHTKFDFPLSNAILYFSTDANRVKNYFQFHSYLNRLRQPTSMRSRDKYALTSLLNAPPYL